MVREGQGEPRMAVARILAAHGLRGEVRCQVLTDFPERFARTRELYGEAGRMLALERARLITRGVILKFAGIENRTEAEKLVGQTLSVPESEAVTLPPDTYFWHQIIGLRARTADGMELGTVVEVLPTGSNDVYVVRGERGEVLVPAVRDVVQLIDLDSGVMVINPLEGLL